MPAMSRITAVVNPGAGMFTLDSEHWNLPSEFAVPEQMTASVPFARRTRYVYVEPGVRFSTDVLPLKRPVPSE